MYALYINNHISEYLCSFINKKFLILLKSLFLKKIVRVKKQNSPKKLNYILNPGSQLAQTK